MTDFALALQGAMRAMLTSHSGVTDLVSADNIIDQTGAPELLPCIFLGEGQTVYNDWHSIVYLDLHIWCAEKGTTEVKKIAGAIFDSIVAPPWQVSGHICHDLRVEQSRFMRDVDEKLSHGVVTVRGILQRAAA
ncbi:MAG: DUF3168 domain-containing protein [Beijerinckiaceae bacterium]